MTPERPFLGQDCVRAVTRGKLIRRTAWLLVQSTLFRWSPRPLHAWRALLLKAFGASIPAAGRVVIFPTVRVTMPWQLVLEDRAMIGPNVTLYNLAPITLRRGANISQNCHLCAGTHDYGRWSMPLVAQPIEIGENVWLGADVFVGPGVVIGELTVVGARSVVVRTLPARKVCVGHPCRPVKDRPEPRAG